MESVGSIVMYWIIVASIIIFSILTVTTRRILRAATYLLFTLFATAGLYFKLDYEFLGAVQIAVYAGGIVVLVVFSILLTTKPGDASSQLTSRRRLFGGVASALALAGLGYAVVARPDFWSTFSRPFDGDFTRYREVRLSAAVRGSECVVTRMYNRWRGNRPQTLIRRWTIYL